MSEAAPETPAVEATPVVAQTPSSAASTETVVERIAEEAVSLVDAVKSLIGFLHDHRTAGDAEVAQAISAAEKAVAAHDAAQA